MIPFIDLQAQFSAHEAAIRARMDAVLAHGQFILGPEVEELEQTLTGYTGAKHCVGCASGTDALQLALMAESVGPGDAVITTAFTFIATAEVIALLGARPVFVDIDPWTWNISPTALEECLRNWNKAWGHPKAVIGVDMFGLPAAHHDLARIAAEYGLLHIEDAAQGFGASIDGRKSCSFGDFSTTSFFPAKPLGCYGDGGAVFCDDPNRAERLRSLRFHGKGKDKHDNKRVGMNSRLDTLQAAILLAKMEVFDTELAARQRLAEVYTKALTDLDAPLVLPHIPTGYRSAWAQYSFLLPSSISRAGVQATMKEAGIPTMIYYPTPLHRQSVFARLDHEADTLSVSEDISGRILSLPMHPYLANDEAEAIVEKLKTALA